jgi:GH35 family endo-1,4-beta-xylanase
MAFYNLALRLKNSGIPIDGVGLQCHFSIGDVDSVKLESTIRRFADAGLKCIITELDMGVPSTSGDNLQEQARNYRVITDIVLNNDNCPNLVIWGLKDNDSWRSSSNPLLYTSSLSKKPAWYAVRSALRHRTIKNTETGIDNAVIPPAATEEYYDLNGRRVSHPAKGLYITKGKKIWIK